MSQNSIDKEKREENSLFMSRFAEVEAVWF